MVSYTIIDQFLRMMMYNPRFGSIKVKKDRSTYMFIQIEL